MKITGTIKPLRDNIIVLDMNFGEQKTKSGFYIPSNDGKTTGIHPRWGKVFAVGPEQKDIKIGEWVLVEHGRWSRTIELENSNGSVVELRMVELKSILLVADEKPSDPELGKE